MHKKALKFLSTNDPVMARLIKECERYTLKPDPMRSPFEALVHAVAHQQLNGTAANTILKRFIAHFPGKRFPSPEDIALIQDEQIRAAGFSRAKILAIRDIADKTIAGIVPSPRKIVNMEDMEIIERLTAVRGVGRWTVEMLLIFKLGRHDVLPVDDFGVRNGFMIAYKKKEMPKPKELAAFGERWKPFRTAAAWYLWRAADMHKELKKKK